ncbi:MAG: DEAD/DEAH box helicase [Xylophilus ampelinus]
MPFASLGLAPALASAAADRGFLAPTAIQAAAIPAILRGVDVQGTAPTGSGKTAAFVLPLLQRLAGGAAADRAGRRPTRALVLAPTRELVAQTGEAARLLAQRLTAPPRVAAVHGGVSINPQMLALRGGAELVVATPGRLLDLAAHNALRLSAVEVLVLDEADRLLDLGFADELARIVALLPAERQNLFFSATFPAPVQALADRLLRAPERIAVAGGQSTAAPGAGAGPDGTATDSGGAAADAPAILQRAIAVDPGRRTALLRHLIREHGWERVLVFVASQHTAEHVAEKLYRAGVYATPFHGGLAQGQRTEVLQEFKDKRWEAVVATDVAARGIDVAGLPAVVNYDLPRSPADHVHRIGRTGRAGERGTAVSFVAPADEAHFRLIEKRQGLRVPRERIPGFEPAEAASRTAAEIRPGTAAPGAGASAGDAPARRDPAAPGNGGVKGSRPSKKDKLRAAATAAAVPDAPAAGVAPRPAPSAPSADSAAPSPDSSRSGRPAVPARGRGGR